MARCYNPQTKYQKSALETYNNTTQTFDATVTGGVPVTFTNVSVDTGCSIESQTGGARILCSGLYEFSVDTTFENVTGGGIVTVQLYQNGVALPCAQASATVAAGDTGSLSFSTRMCVSTCAATQPSYSVVFTSTTATEVEVTHVALGVVKLA